MQRLSNKACWHLQLLFHPLLPETVKAINQHQMKGATPDPHLIKDPEMQHLVEKFNLMEEMFGNKAAGQVEANKQVKPQMLLGLAVTGKQQCSHPLKVC